MEKNNKQINLRDCRMSLLSGTIIDNRYIRLFIITYLFSFFLLLTGCVFERLDKGPDYEDESATLYLNLDIPGMNPALNSGYNPNSRAMSLANEVRIDYNNIHVLVFEVVGQDELFRYQAVITALAPPQITLKIPVDQVQAKYRFVVVANAGIPFIADGTPKNEAMNNFVFDCVGKWNTSDESLSLIPMWGEYSKLITIKDNMFVNVLMYLALARVDVGALFKFNNPNPVTGQEYPAKDTDKESVWGLSNFKIKDIRVYRTLNKAYVASSANKIVSNEVVAPNIPLSTKYNSDSGAGFDDLKDADNQPLIYTLLSGDDSYIREIYIPESFPIDANLSSGNVPCLVIGGYYGENNNSVITYYRADFATYRNGKVLNYLPLLRNHRFVFDIRSVVGPGYEDAGQALNSIISDMTLDVKNWNELPLNYNVNGNYYCSIDTRELVLDARPAEGVTEVSDTIFYKTNLSLDPVSNPFTYEWKSSGSTYNDDFDIFFDYSEKTIIVKAKNENVAIGAHPISEQIEIIVGNYLFTIDVKQKAINADFTPDCFGAVVHGIYRTDFALNYTNYISVRLTSPETLRGHDYDISTNEKNGIYFATKGVFDTDGTYSDGLYEYELILKGYGTLINETGFLSSFDIMMTFNSITPATCTVGIPVE